MKHAVKRIHFVGVGGAGMSGIAEILHNLGYHVSGSDQSDSATLRRLGQLGIAVHIGHDAAHIRGAEAVVTSTAVKGDNPEVIAARARARAGGAARGDAGRADAAQAGHRDRRHARQDDDHQPGDERAGAGRARSDLRHRRAAECRRRQFAPRQGRLHRRRGRRERCVVPEPAAGDVGRDQHRRRPHGHLRPRLRAAEAGLRRVHPPHAVLRRGDRVHRRSGRALDPADDLAPDRQLRLRRGRDGACGRRAPRRRRHALHGAAAQRRAHARCRA